MLSVLPNIPVVIQPKFTETVLGSSISRNCTELERVFAGFAEPGNTVVESPSLWSFDSIPGDCATSFFSLSKRLSTEQFRDSPGFLQFICNSSSQLVSAGTAGKFSGNMVWKSES